MLCHVVVQRYKSHLTGPQKMATNKNVFSGSVSGTAFCVSPCRVCDNLRGLYNTLYQLLPNESNPTISDVKLYQQKKKNILGHGSSLQSVSPTRSTGASWQDARGLISLQVLSWRSLQVSVHSSVSSQGPSSNGSEQTSNIISLYI